MLKESRMPLDQTRNFVRMNWKIHKALSLFGSFRGKELGQLKTLHTLPILSHLFHQLREIGVTVHNWLW